MIVYICRSSQWMISKLQHRQKIEQSKIHFAAAGAALCFPSMLILLYIKTLPFSAQHLGIGSPDLIAGWRPVQRAGSDFFDFFNP